MKTQTFHLEIITPCFCGGAEPERQAEIRAASIRGQLRWWFRVLGGFKSLAPLTVRKQEAMIFGSTAGDKGTAGKLVVRVSQPVISHQRENANDMRPGMQTPLGYALFPLRPMEVSDGGRGKIQESQDFTLQIDWRGESRLKDDINALLHIWGSLGGLGFRSRRGFGSLHLKNPSVALQEALSFFQSPNSICVKELHVAKVLSNWRETAEKLLEWYQSWRQHGQMHRRWDGNNKCWVSITDRQKASNRSKPGFRWARRDHNEGLDVLHIGAPNPDPENPHGQPGITYRPALGLPIIQFFSSLDNDRGRLPRGRATVNWEWDWNAAKHKAEGRFASPVLLRPHRDASGKWHALVIFVDAQKWPVNKKVYLNGQPREVSLDLYEEMKRDQALKPFLP